jgi:hypothetical protein
MLGYVSRLGAASGWFAAVVVPSVGSVLLGFGIDASTAVLWLVACLTPPAVMLLGWPSASSQTVAELLHSVESSEAGPTMTGRAQSRAARVIAAAAHVSFASTIAQAAFHLPDRDSRLSAAR